MPCPPSLQPRKGIVFFLGAADLDQRMPRDAALRWLHARGLAGLLLVMRRPWRIAKAFFLMPGGKVQKRDERRRMLIDVGVPIAYRREARGHRRQREVAGLARVDLVPCERGRDACIGFRSYGVRGCNGAILRVLVVVEE